MQIPRNSYVYREDVFSLYKHKNQLKWELELFFSIFSSSLSDRCLRNAKGSTLPTHQLGEWNTKGNLQAQRDWNVGHGLVLPGPDSAKAMLCFQMRSLGCEVQKFREFRLHHLLKHHRHISSAGFIKATLGAKPPKICLLSITSSSWNSFSFSKQKLPEGQKMLGLQASWATSRLHNHLTPVSSGKNNLSSPRTVILPDQGWRYRYRDFFFTGNHNMVLSRHLCFAL